MILEWGMSEKLGFVRYSGHGHPRVLPPRKDYSDDTARSSTRRSSARVPDEAYADAEDAGCSTSNWDARSRRSPRRC
jgi:ATP-dependent Zn protease